GSLEMNKTLSWFNGVSLVVGMQIGSGIFSSPAAISIGAGSAGASLIVWILAGVLAWTGACCYVELGTMLPVNGSSQAYLSYIYGPMWSFLFSWMVVLLLKPGSAAIIAIVFGQYSQRAMIGDSTYGGFLASELMQKLLAIAGLSLITAINMMSPKSGAKSSNLFFVLKSVLIAIILCIGLYGSYFPPLSGPYTTTLSTSASLFEGTTDSFGKMAVAIYAGVWAYDGWDNVNYVAGELRHCNRDFPRIIHLAMPLVILSYLLINLSYYAVLTLDEVKQAKAIALEFTTKVLGGFAGQLVSLLIALSCVGSLNATVFTATRATFSAAQRGFLPKVFSRLNEGRANTPTNALMLNTVLTLIYVVAGAFRSLISLYGVASYTFYLMTVAGVLVLKYREPELQRSYRTWWITPIVFCGVALCLILRGIIEQPVQALVAYILMALGAGVYLVKLW
ncbi:amino acid transporter, partial [Nadsonia fulvescens var. elongata DSM 6958]